MLELNKYGFHVFQYKVISVSNYKRNYSTQTLSSSSSLVAKISCQVMKHNNELENRPHAEKCLSTHSSYTEHTRPVVDNRSTLPFVMFSDSSHHIVPMTTHCPLNSDN